MNVNENLTERVSEDPLSFVDRLILVFTDPLRAFSDIVANPRWLGAFVIILLFSLVSVNLTMPYIMDLRREAIQQQIDMNPDQAEAMMDRLPGEGGPGAGIFMSVLTIAAGFIELLIVAGVLMFGGSFLLGGESNFNTVIAVTAYSLLIRVPKIILTVPLIVAKKSMSVSTSLAILIPFEDWRSPLGILLGQVDIFKIWSIALLVLGLSMAYRFSKSKSAALVIGFFSLWVAVQVALSALQSSLFAGMAG